MAALAKEVRELKKQLPARPRAGDVSADKLLAEAEDSAACEGRRGRSRPAARPTRCGSLIDQMRQEGQPDGRAAGQPRRGQGDARGRHQPRPGSPRLNAGDWIRGAAEVVGGSGGGKPDMAQAGGKDPEKLPERARRGPQGDPKGS